MYSMMLAVQKFCPIYTLGVGNAFGEAALLLSAGSPVRVCARLPPLLLPSCPPYCHSQSHDAPPRSLVLRSLARSLSAATLPRASAGLPALLCVQPLAQQRQPDPPLPHPTPTALLLLLSAFLRASARRCGRRPS